MLRHPVQHGVGDHDVGVGRGRPGGDVGAVRVDAGRPGGVDHLRGAVERLDPASGQRAASSRGEVPGAAAQVDDAARARGARPGRAGRGRAGRGGRRRRGRPPGPRWCSPVIAVLLSASSAGDVRGDLARRRAGSVPASGRTCSTVPSRPGTLRCTNQAPPPGRSRWWRLRIEPSTRACTASGTRPASTRRNRRAGRSASRTAAGPPSVAISSSTASTTASAPFRHTARLTRCQPTRRGPSAVSARAATGPTT